MDKLNVIKDLRQQTNLSISECKKALENVNYNINEAYKLLQYQVKNIADLKKNRLTKTGTFGVYAHNNSTILGIVELLSETDFVAKNSDFKSLARDLAAQVVFSENLKFISEEAFFESEANVTKTINNDEIFLNQFFFKNETITIKELLDQNSAKFGEKLHISNFYRYSI